MKKNLLIQQVIKNEVHVEEIYLAESNYSDILNIQKPVIDNLTFYRKSKINLSRHKIDLLKENKGISITRKESNADYTIISEEYLRNLYYMNNVRVYSLEKLSAVFKIILDGTEILKNTLDCYDNCLIEIKKIRLNSIEHDKYISCYVIPTNIINTSYVTDLYMNAACNQYLKVLDNEDLENIENIIESTADLTVVIEMLANCNTSKSADIIAYILCKHGCKLSTCKAYNHVNFKALKNKFRYYTNRVYKLKFISHVIEKMANDGYLTKFILNVLVQDYVNFIKRFYMKNDVIKIKQIKVNESIKSKVIKLRRNEIENV